MKDSKVVVITGGSSGIGLATARLFGEQGWRVGLVARGAPALRVAASQLRAEGIDVATATADVADGEALDRAARILEATLGPVDVWINNAAVGIFAGFLETSEAEFRRLTEINYLGTVNGTRAALRRMVPRDAGTVVNVCSAIGFRGVPLQSAYSGSKWAMRGFGEAMLAELAHQGSRVHLSTVYPPSVNTPFYDHATSRLRGVPRPPPPVYQPEVVAKGILFAATGGRRDVMIGGQTVATKLLNAVAPRLADLLLAAIGPRAQTSSDEAGRRRDVNLFKPAADFAGEHGTFDGEALGSSLQLWVSRHRAAVLGAVAVAGALAVLGRRRR